MIRGSLHRTDLAVYSFILLLGALQFFFCLRSPDAPNDATYVELARSILEQHAYQFDFRPETLYPPGFALILAAVSLIAGYGQAILFRVVAVSTTLGLLASYELLRRIEGRAFAAVSCLLLGSSPALFAFGTSLVLSDMPYFAASMIALLLAVQTERSAGRFRVYWMALFGIALVASLMVRSSGLAILMGLAPWVAISLKKNRAVGLARFRVFLVPFLLGLGAQALWSEWATHHQFKEWPLPGWPQSYFSQLELKSGNDPELGKAQLRDIPVRIEENVEIRSAELVRLVTHKAWINPNWLSPAVLGIVTLVALGLFASVWNGGGHLHDWYFIGYELMYVLWPWNFEIRFLLPIVPLALLYVWRGGKFLVRFSTSHPRESGLILAGASGVLSLASLVWVVHAKALQPVLATLFWAAVTITGCFLISRRVPIAGPRRRAVPGVLRIPADWSRLLRASVLSLAALIIGAGVSEQVRLARRNLTFDAATGVFYGDIEAGEWIKTHEPQNFVVMARKQDLLFHYSRHMVVWFPPITDTKILMDGIRKYHVRLVVVADHPYSYWQPPDQDCFRSLFQAYRQDFRLVHRGPGDSIFEVQDEPGSMAGHST